MKLKIILVSIMTIISSLLFTNSVSASTSFYESTYIPNMYVNKEKDGKIRYQQARFLRRGGDDQFAYCIEPWSEISDTVNYDDIVDINSLDDATLERLSLIAYYGYGYKNHTDSKWYYITQVLIWKEVDKEADFYFTDKLNGTKVNTYTNNMNEVLNLVEKHLKKPNFSLKRTQLLFGTNGTIIDINNVLEEYEIIKYPDNVNLDKKGNRINIEPTKIGDSELILERKDSTYNVAPIVYRHPVNQNFLTVGSYKPMTYTYPIHIFGGEITIEKIDSITNSSTPSGSASLLGSIFEIYNSKEELIETVSLIDDTSYTITNLSADTYTIIEKEAGTGYIINKEVTSTTLDRFNTTSTVTIKNDVITNEITIEKYYGNNKNIWSNEEGAVFSIYDKNNNLVKEVITDSTGKATFTLPYGTYRVSQSTGMKNYYKVEDFIITVSDEGKTQTFKKYNNEITGSITIVKVDKDTLSPITNNKATFMLVNLDTNEIIGTYQTNEEGFVIINDLSLATYQIIEITPPEGYLLGDTNKSVTLDTTNKEVVQEFINQLEIKHEISVPNTSIIQTSFGKEIIYDPKKYYRNYFTTISY